MDQDVRKRLHEIYRNLDELLTELKDTMRSEPDLQPYYEPARAYWLASLDVGLNAAEYVTFNPTFSGMLEDLGIMDYDGEFIECEEEC